MFSYHGGMLWVDFINTEYMHQGTVQDQIEELQGLLDWAAGADMELEGIRAEALQESAERQRADWQELAILRGDLRRMAEEVGETAAASEATRATLNRHLAALPGVWQIEHGEEGAMAPSFVPQGGWEQRLRWRLLQSVLEFLRDGQVARLKRCSNHECIQYYFDTSKNNTRRWCRMEVCGNREKAKRHYRKKTGGQQDE
jgi:predicted RNA-binding Zn ribbon-like protein